MTDKNKFEWKEEHQNTFEKDKNNINIIGYQNTCCFY